MVAGCYDLVLRQFALGTDFSTSYELPGFFLSGLWFQNNNNNNNNNNNIDNNNGAESVPFGVAAAMATIAFLHVGFLIVSCLSAAIRNAKLPDSASWFYAYFGASLRNYWLGFLGLAVGGIVTTGLSGFSVWLLFLHAWFEGWLFSLRVATYLRLQNSIVPILLPPAVFIIIGLSAMIASDSPIDKAIITLVPAFISDIGNIVVCSLLLRRSQEEEANGADPEWRFGMDSKDHLYELLFVVMHFVIFYPQLGLACALSPHDLSILLLSLFSANAALLLYVNLTQTPVHLLSRHKIDPSIP